MEEILLTYRQIAKIDPTHTTGLRNAFVQDMKRRFQELIVVIRQTVNVRDCFGLRPDDVRTFQMTPSGAGAFAFRRSSEKVETFMKWLEEQVNKGILSVTQYQQIGLSVEAAWTNKYISDSYKRGVIRARYELRKAGFKVPSMDDTGGINVSMMSPFHIDRIGLLFTRVFSDLRGITAAMDMQISRILAQGIADGDGPALLARKLVATVNGTGMGELGITDTLGRFIPASRRAIILARTEIIRSFHQAAVQEYRNWAVEGVYVKGEWKTAGDGRVCEECASLEGRVFTLDEIENMIPLHPQCRCIALPWIAELQKYR